MDTNRKNPFFDAEVHGVGVAVLHLLDRGKPYEAWQARIAEARQLMEREVLSRLNAAVSVAGALGYDFTATGIFETSTCTGVLHLRAKLMRVIPSGGHALLQFIASPKSGVVAAEAELRSERRRWKNMALCDRVIAAGADRVIGEFIRWAVD